MNEEKKELFTPADITGVYIMVGGLQKGKVLEIAPEIREKVQEKGLGFPLTEMVGAYFTSKQIKAYSKSELKKLKKEKEKKEKIKEAVKKTEKVVAKNTKKNTAKKTTTTTKKELVKEERKETNAAIQWFTQVLQDSLGGI